MKAGKGETSTRLDATASFFLVNRKTNALVWCDLFPIGYSVLKCWCYTKPVRSPHSNGIAYGIKKLTGYRRAIKRVGIEALTCELISQYDWTFPVVNGKRIGLR